VRGDFNSIVMATAALLDDKGQAIISMSRQDSQPSVALANLILDVNSAYDNQDRNWVSLKIELTNITPPPA
jgi:hypothetical protein